MQLDFDKHNEEVACVWDAYNRGCPIRPPVALGINPRYILSIPDANPSGITFPQYFDDPLTMLRRQCEHTRWVRHDLPHDIETGPPTQGFWVYVDSMNMNAYEAEWFGVEPFCEPDQVIGSKTLPNEDNKRMPFDKGIPAPFFGGAMEINWRFYSQMSAIKDSGFEYMGCPEAKAFPSGLVKDGPMTACCNLRGAEAFCADLAGDPEYADDLLDYVTEATIQRIWAYRRQIDEDVRPQSLCFADDSIQLISTGRYIDQVMPYHKKLIDEFSLGSPNTIHLCGDAARHYPVIAEKLNVKTFDTGFPVHFSWLKANLCDDVAVMGGPSVPFMEIASSGEVYSETERILSTGIAAGRRFVLREGNNPSPGIGPDKVAELCRAAKELGPKYA